MYLNRHGRPIHCRTWQNYSNVACVSRSFGYGRRKSACICGFLLSLYATSLEHMKSNGVQSLFEKIENPLAAVLAEMEKAGIATDQKRWEAVCHELKVRERKLLSLIYEAAGEEFNVNSPKQLGVILFERWACRPARRQRTVIPQRQMCWKCWRKVIPL